MIPLSELLLKPRMNFAEYCDNNSCIGLLDMINEIVKPDFTIVEIGSYAGVSSDLFARYCKKLLCIDVWIKGSKGFNNDQLTYAWNEFKKVLYDHDNIGYLMQPSIEASEKIESETIDMVYIDAVHDYEDVLEDIKTWLPKVKKDGYVCGHDIHMPGVEKAVKEMFGNDYKTYNDTSWMHKK